MCIAYSVCLWLSGKLAWRLMQSVVAANFSLAIATKLLKDSDWRLAGLCIVSTMIRSNSNKWMPVVGLKPAVTRRALPAMRANRAIVVVGGIGITDMSSRCEVEMKVGLCGVKGP